MATQADVNAICATVGTTTTFADCVNAQHALYKDNNFYEMWVMFTYAFSN